MISAYIIWSLHSHEYILVLNYGYGMIRACLQSVVQCGLEGIRVERLYTTLSHDDVWGHNFTEGFYQEKVSKY